MSTTALSTETRASVTSTPSSNSPSSVPPPSRLTAAQRRELEAELRRGLVALERRIVSERQADSAEADVAATHDVSFAMRGTSEIFVRRDPEAGALAGPASAS